MARVPDLKRLAAEDFPADDQPLVRKLAFIINSFHEQVRDALNRKIDFDNLSQEVRTLSFATNSSGQPLNTITFQSSLLNRVQGILPVRTVITSNNTQSAQTMPVITWSQNAKLVTITNIGGLLPETQYEITILTL
jgi:hypothetical protein